MAFVRRETSTERKRAKHNENRAGEERKHYLKFLHPDLYSYIYDFVLSPINSYKLVFPTLSFRHLFTVWSISIRTESFPTSDHTEFRTKAFSSDSQL